MVKISSKGLLYVLGLSAALLAQSTGAFAQLPPMAFKGFSKSFRANKKHYDSVIGAATFEGGFTYDMRFLGNFKPAYNKENKRDYSNDTSSDPLWNLTKIFFPSPSGQLTTERAIATNFGKNATPKTVSLLHNFTHSLREGETVDEKQLIQQMFASFKPFKSTAEAPELVVASVQTLKKFGDTNVSTLKKHLPLPKPAWEALKKDILEIGKKTSADDVKKQEIVEKIQVHLRKKEEDDIKKNRAAFEKEMIEKTLSPLLEFIKQSIKSEPDSLYLAHTTEQIISSFFSAHFNTQADIRELMENLDDRIVDKTMLSKEDDYLKQEDLPDIAAKTTSYELDEVYDLAEASIWTAVTPYKEGMALLSNGNTYRYDRKHNKLRAAEETFADCAEIAGRHIMSLLLYDSNFRKYDLSELKKSIKPGNRYFANFEDFFIKHSPTFANAGDTMTRSSWNKAVGDLNTFDDSLHIDYVKGTNELNAGFVNFVRVFQKIFGLTIDDLPTTGLQAKKDWLEQSLDTLFRTVNPNKTYTFDLSDVRETANDLSGNIDIKVGDTQMEEDLFSFRFYSNPHDHSDVKNLKTLKKIQGKDYNAELNIHPTILQQNTVEEALWMVSPAKVRDAKISHPLYKLFNTPLADNNSKIAFLKTIQDNYQNWENTFLSTTDKQQAFKSILGNVLNEISWDDASVLTRVSPIIMNLAKKTDLQPIFSEKVRGLAVRLSDTAEANFIKNTFKNVERLDLRYSQISEIDVAGLDKLTYLNLGQSKTTNIKGLKALTGLQELILASIENLKEIDVENLDQLKKLSFRNSAIADIKGLSTLKNLENLDLYLAVNLKTVNIGSLASLKELDIGGAKNVKELEFTEDRKDLKTKLQGSGITRRSQIKGVEHLDEANITW